MKAIVLLLFTLALSAGERAKILRVIDGDTLLTEALWVPDPLPKSIYIRVAGIDTPEIKGHCAREKELAQRAKEYTQKFVDGGDIEVQFKEWDKYGGRILGAVSKGTDDLAASLLSAGLARPYSGNKKQGWCG